MFRPWNFIQTFNLLAHPSSSEYFIRKDIFIMDMASIEPPIPSALPEPNVSVSDGFIDNELMTSNDIRLSYTIGFYRI
jgi:hypothetical protein